jgi:small subunit ribosomal protein S2
MVKIPTIEEMLKAGMHFGHRTSKWHPKAAFFIFGSRNGVHIIDLAKSQEMLALALEFIKKTVSEGKTVLLVGTKTQVKKTLKKIAEESGMPYITERWLGGCLTNFNSIKKSIKRYNDLVEKRQAGKLEKYTKKERLEFDREIAKLEMKVGGISKLTKTPDAVFIWDIKKEETALAEAKKRKIPIIAVCDTNVDPTGVDYIIPANDDASKTVKLILNLVEEAIEEGRKEGNNKAK